MEHIEKEAEIAKGKATSKSNLVTLFSTLHNFSHLQQKYIEDVENREDEVDIYEVLYFLKGVLNGYKEATKELGLIIGANITEEEGE